MRSQRIFSSGKSKEWATRPRIAHIDIAQFDITEITRLTNQGIALTIAEEWN